MLRGIEASPQRVERTREFHFIVNDLYVYEIDAADSLRPRDDNYVVKSAVQLVDDAPQDGDAAEVELSLVDAHPRAAPARENDGARDHD